MHATIKVRLKLVISDLYVYACLPVISSYIVHGLTQYLTTVLCIIIIIDAYFDN